MRRSLLFALVAILAQPAIGAEPPPIPRAVIADPKPDLKNPPFTAPLLIPSHGSNMLGWLFAASGPGPKPIAILLHGLPGNERNLDLAQAIRRAGWDVLTFTYRGAWGSEGDFSIANSIEDTAAALDWARSDEAKGLGVDKRRIVLAGHSMGGADAMITAAHDGDLRGLILIDAWNPAGTAARMAKASPSDAAKFREGFSSYGPSLRLPKKDSVADELIAHGAEWDLPKFATSVHLPTLSIGAEYGNGAPNDDLVKAIRAAGNRRVQGITMKTDHSFTDHRIALEAAVVRWLQGLR